MTFVVWLIVAFLWGIVAGIAIGDSMSRKDGKTLEQLTDEELLALKIVVFEECAKRGEKIIEEDPFEGIM